MKDFLPKVCFYHIEKCMGSSLRIMLYNYYKNIFNENEIYLPEFYDNINLICHNDLEKIYSYNNFKVLLCHCSFNKLNVTNYFSDKCYSIICVREPIKRFISHYYFFNKNETNKNIKELTIDELKLIIYNHSNNILNWRLSGETNNLDDALNNLKIINCILITEQINTDINFLNNILNIKYNINKDFIYEKLNIKKELYDENSDYEYIKMYLSNEFSYDYIIYNTIINMKIEERIKLLN